MANKTVLNRQGLALELAVTSLLCDSLVGIHHVGEAPAGPGFCAPYIESRGLKTSLL